MSVDYSRTRDDTHELFRIGPLKGLDPTTAAYELDPASGLFPDGENIIPQANYGGFSTVLGRKNAFSNTLPAPPTGAFVWHRPGGLMDVYFFYVTDGSGQGQIYWATLGGAFTKLASYPQASVTGYAANALASFCATNRWCFMTDGSTGVVKIDQNLNVTWSGITPPGALVASPQSIAGNLLGQYTYCCTFDDGGIVESSQGAISQTVQVGNLAWQGSVTIAGVPANNDTVTFYFNPGGQVTQFGPRMPETSVVSITVNGTPTVAQVAGQLAAAVASQLNAYFSSVVANGATLTFTTQLGAVITQGWYYATSTGGTTVTPTTQTFITGGSTGGQVQLNGLPVSVDPQVANVNIYRIGGSIGQWRRIAQVANGTTTFRDNLADSAIIGQTLIVHRDVPPAFTSIASHQGRTIGFGTRTDPSAVWISNYNEPFAFNNDSGVLHADYAGFGDSAVACGSIGTVLVLCKQRSLYTLWGSTDADFQIFFNEDTGIAAPRSLVCTRGVARWLSRRGVVAFDGQVVQNISDGAFRQSNIKKPLDGLKALTRLGCAAFYADRAYHLSIPALGKTFRYDERTQAWYRLGWAFGIAITDPESDVSVLASNLTSAGEVDQWFADNLDLGNPVVAYITSALFVGEIDATYQADFVRIEGPQQPPGMFCTYTITANPGAVNAGPDKTSPAVQSFTSIVPLDGSIGGGLNVRQDRVSSSIIGYDLQLTLTVSTAIQMYIGKIAVFGNDRRRMIMEG